MAPTITLSGLTTHGVITDSQEIYPFGSVTIADSLSGDLVNATISFRTANGTLAGAGLSAGVFSSETEMVTYTLSAATPAALQTALRGLTFTPTAHEGAVGTQVWTTFSLTVTDTTYWTPVTPTPMLVRTFYNSVPDLVAVDAAGDAYVDYPGVGTVAEFNTSGALVRTLPSGVMAIDAAGDEFVEYPGAGTVEEFNASGVLVRTLALVVPTLTFGQNYLGSLTTDAAGDLFVTYITGDNGFYGGTVEEFNAAGALLRTLSVGNYYSYGLTTDASGDVFVENSDDNTIAEFSATGSLVRTLSSGVRDPESLATDAAGDLFVANTGNNTVEEFNASGVLLRTLSSVDGVSYPVRVATDAAGDVFVANNGGNTVEEFNASGVLLRTLKGVGVPDGLAIDAAGDVFVENTNNGYGTVEEYNASGVLLRALPGVISDPVSVATDAAGDVFVANSGNNTVLEFNASGVLLRALTSGLSNPVSLATDAAGDVFVANSDDDTVAEFSASGALVRTLSSGIYNPASVATDAAGDVFVANPTANTVTEFNAAGALLRTLSSGVSVPVSVATDAAGDVFVANSGANTVEEFNASGALVNTLSSGVSDPVSVATDAADDVFVANDGNNTVEEFNASGALVATLSSGISQPDSVAIDVLGDVFVANYANNTVAEFDVSGVLMSVLSSGEDISGPRSLATDAAGNLFVANSSANTVEEFQVLQLTSVSDGTTQIAVNQTAKPIGIFNGVVTITGASNQMTLSEAPVDPFSGVTVDDPSSGATDALTITVGGAGGTLSGSGLAGGTGGVYTLAGTAAAITSELDALSFTPNAGQPGATSTSTFTLSDLSSAYSTPTVNTTTSVIDKDAPVDWSITNALTGPAGEIYALYEGLLGRAPDPFGYENWMAALQGGQSLVSIAQDFLNSAEYANDFGTNAQLSDAQFLDDLYQTALHRAPDPGGLQTYEAALASGETRQAVALDVILSPEAQSDLQPTFNSGVFAPDAQTWLFGAFVQNFSGAQGQVYELYEGLVGRAPDPVGFEIYVSALQGGATLNSLALDFLGSAEFTADFGNYAQLSDTQFLDDLYQTALHRQPDPGGLQYYETALANGAPRQGVALSIVMSPEAQADLLPSLSQGVFAPNATDSEIARLYYGLLDRAPDPSGLANWESAVANGMSLTAVTQDSLNSSEYLALYGRQTDAQFVTTLYQDALGRAPDSAGFAGWNLALASGASRASVALGITESSEAQQHLAANIELGLKLA